MEERNAVGYDHILLYAYMKISKLNSCLLNSIPYGRMLCSDLIQRGGPWSCSHLIYQTLSTSHGSPYLLGGVDEERAAEEEGGTRRGEEREL